MQSSSISTQKNKSKFLYQTNDFIQEQQLNILIEQLNVCKIQELQIDLNFNSDHYLNAFQEKYYEQQLQEKELNYSDGIQKYDSYFNSTERDLKQRPFFSKNLTKIQNMKVKQLKFYSFQQVLIFTRIYQTRLKQIEYENKYTIRVNREYLLVYYPKDEPFSTFFLNQIIQLKQKLQIYNCFNPKAVQKIRFSPYYHKILEKQKISAQFHNKWRGVPAAIFYSKQYSNYQQLIDTIRKVLSENMTIIQLKMTTVYRRENQIFFGLFKGLHSNYVSSLSEQQQILIQANEKSFSYNIHDRHECFDSAKKAVLNIFQNVIYFKLEGTDSRRINNFIFKNDQNYSYLRAKFKMRNLYIVFNYKMYCSQKDNYKYFSEIVKQMFENLNEKHRITFYLQPMKIYAEKQFIQFLQSISHVTAQGRITTLNQSIQQKQPISTIGFKQLTEFSLKQTRNRFYQVLMELMTKQKVSSACVYSEKSEDSAKQFKKKQVEVRASKKPIKTPSNSSKKNSQILSSKHSTNRSEESLLQEISVRSPEAQYSKILSKSILSDSSKDSEPVVLEKTFPIDSKLGPKKKPKCIPIEFPYNPPVFVPNLEKLCQKLPTERIKDLEKKITKAYDQLLEGLAFRIYRLQIRLDLPLLEMDTSCFYLSSKLDYNNELGQFICHLIDLNELNRIKDCQKTSKKHVYILYKQKQKEKFWPSFVIDIL